MQPCESLVNVLKLPLNILSASVLYRCDESRFGDSDVNDELRLWVTSWAIELDRLFRPLV